MIDLTIEQRKALLEGQPVRIAVPEIGKDIVLVEAEWFENIRDLVEEAQERRAIAQVAVRHAAQRLLEDEQQ